MPKELIRGIPEGTSDAPIDLGIEVSWGRDSGHVQIATVNLAKQSFTPEYGWFRDINRDEINRLIKTLRKARDQAYGVDE